MSDATWAHVFEGLSVALPIVIWLVIRTKLGGDPRYYAGLLACASCFLWEWYMSVGPLQFHYSEPAFLDLWTVDGWGPLVAMDIPAYGWYWFLPNLFLLPNVRWIDEHWGRWQYLWIWLITGAWNLAVEWPFTTLTELWDYHWKDTWSIGGLPVANPPIAGVTSLLIYVFLRRLMSTDSTGGIRRLYLPYTAWTVLAFYITWVPSTWILNATRSHWHA